MIDVKCNAGHCEMMLNGTGAEITKETGMIIKSVYNAIMKSCPAGFETVYANLYRMHILKAITECTTDETP